MSFDQLIAIKKESAELGRADRDAPLVECPYDGEPLEYREKDQTYNCPLGNYRTRRTTRDPAGP